MTRFAVIVEFSVGAQNHDRFRELILENAAASLRDEPGCRQFDVLVPEGGSAGGEFSLYEIYDNADAFAQHLKAQHYLQFDAISAPLVVNKKVIRLSILEPGA
jgi:(4S)-4-hydroxy-5-phosphonooxypentane-2,3-dione isomerase